MFKYNDVFFFCSYDLAPRNVRYFDILHKKFTNEYSELEYRYREVLEKNGAKKLDYTSSIMLRTAGNIKIKAKKLKKDLNMQRNQTIMILGVFATFLAFVTSVTEMIKIVNNIMQFSLFAFYQGFQNFILLMIVV